MWREFFVWISRQISRSRKRILKISMFKGSFQVFSFSSYPGWTVLPAPKHLSLKLNSNFDGCANKCFSICRYCLVWQNLQNTHFADAQTRKAGWTLSLGWPCFSRRYQNVGTYTIILKFQASAFEIEIRAVMSLLCSLKTDSHPNGH